MRGIGVALAVLLAVRAFAFDWTGRTGVVTLTETAEVTDADAATVAALQGVVLEGETTELVFRIADALTFAGTITGDGTIVKCGRGTLTLSCPKTLPVSAAGTKYKDHFTTGGIVVEEGVLKLRRARA